MTGRRRTTGWTDRTGTLRTEPLTPRMWSIIILDLWTAFSPLIILWKAGERSLFQSCFEKWVGYHPGRAACGNTYLYASVVSANTLSPLTSGHASIPSMTYPEADARSQHPAKVMNSSCVQDGPRPRLGSCLDEWFESRGTLSQNPLPVEHGAFQNKPSGLTGTLAPLRGSLAGLQGRWPCP